MSVNNDGFQEETATGCDLSVNTLIITGKVLFVVSKVEPWGADGAKKAALKVTEVV